MRLLFLLVILVTLSQAPVAQKPLPFGSPALPAGFLKNLGQVRDFGNQPVDFVYYQANIGQQQVFITNYGLSLLLARPKKIIRTGGATNYAKAIANRAPIDSVNIVSYEMERIDIVLQNGNIIPANITTKAQKGSPIYHLYFDDPVMAEQDQLLQNEVLVKNVYPGIDWKVYIRHDDSKGPSLKYDFIVHPGADPARIRLHYSDNVKLVASGAEISAQARMGQIKESKPYSYLKEEWSEVNVTYHVQKNTISFRTPAYDHNQTLVIDPSIFWMTYLSSTNYAVQFLSIYGNDVETDGDGNIFVQLSASGRAPFPTKNPGGGAYYQDYTASPNGSMIICKFASGGQMLWCTYFGNGVVGRVMTIDKFGNIAAIGMEHSGTPSSPNPNPTIPLLNNGGYYDGVRKKYFITKFSGSGTLLWSSYYVNFSSYPMDMSYDINGNVYVVGWSERYDFPVADPGGGAYVVKNAQFGYAQTLFISQFDQANQLSWSTRIEGNSYDPHARVCTDKSGNIYIGGQTRSSNYPLVNAGGYFNTNSWGSVLTRFNPSRQMTWSTYIPGAFAFADLTTDNNNNLYVILDRRILKFNAATDLVFEKSVTTTQMHFWDKINYDPVHNQIQILGHMNDAYWGFPTINTICNGSFFNNGINPHTYTNATGPIFATINTDGDFLYRSLVDWVAEYYEQSEMTIDVQGNPIYLFGHNQNTYLNPNPQLTNPGNGAYFDNMCCYNGGTGSGSALLLKLITSEISVDTQITTPSGCNCDGVVNLVPKCGQAPFTYEWSNGATTQSASGLCPGNYRVKVTDANNLFANVTVAVPYPPGSISSIIPALIPENCNRLNGAIDIQTIQGGVSPYTYSLDGILYQASPLFTGLDSGSHIVRVKDGMGCIFTDTLLLTRIKGPSAIFYTSQKTSCMADDGAIQVTNVVDGIGPFEYTLNTITANNTGSFTHLAASDYLVTVSDTAGCTFSETVTVDKASAATDATYSAANDHCAQGIGSLQVIAVTGGTAPYTFSVDSATFVPNTINNLMAGNYSLYIRDAMGCVLKKGPVTIANDSGPIAIDFNTTHAWCGALTGTIRINSVKGGSLPYVYAIDGNSPVTSPAVTGIQPGTHSLYVQDAYGCRHEQQFAIDFKPVAKVVLLPADTLVCYDEMVSLTLTGDVDQFKNMHWNVPAQGFTARIKATGEQKVWVKITDHNNCIIQDTSIIHVKACNGPEKCIAIPTAFTPNNDGKNETIGPVTKGCRIQSISFAIYNRWGELVFETNKIGDEWDGNFKGIPQPAGGYIFVCSYVGDDAVARQRKGTLILVR